MTLVSVGIRLTRIFAEVPWGRSVKRRWCCRERQFSAFSPTLKMRPALLHSDTQSVRRRFFSDLKMHDLEWIFRIKFCFRAGLAGSDRAIFENKIIK